MKTFLTILFALSSFALKAQNKVIVKYYDSSGFSSPKEKARFYTELEKQEDAIYKCTSYYLPSNKLYSKSFNADTLFSKSLGLTLVYYESGKLKDSTLYGNGKNHNSYSFYENGNLRAHSYYDETSRETKSEGYDENGKLIPNYVYEKPIEFSGGIKGWINYLQHNLRSETPVINNAPNGKYIVYVTFIVDKQGNISDVKAENNPGYGTKEEAIRVIENGPKWMPAIQYNEAVVRRHKQAIAFVVE
jgi:antitoxin component YwqK of YwqJK toxin-antitoxin module